MSSHVQTKALDDALEAVGEASDILLMEPRPDRATIRAAVQLLMAAAQSANDALPRGDVSVREVFADMWRLRA